MSALPETRIASLSHNQILQYLSNAFDLDNWLGDQFETTTSQPIKNLSRKTRTKSTRKKKGANQNSIQLITPSSLGRPLRTFYV